MANPAYRAEVDATYLYVYDQRLGERRYAKLSQKIEARALDLDIRGRIIRLSPLKNLRETLEDGVERGVKTAVAVGDDTTFYQLLNASHRLNVVLGFVPIDSGSQLARALGIPPFEAAVDVVAARMVKRLDVGRANSHTFIDAAEIENPDQAMIQLGGYTLSVDPTCDVAVCNLGFSTKATRGSVFNPTDGQLEIVVQPRARGAAATKLPMKQVLIKDSGQSVTVKLDSYGVVKTPVLIEVETKSAKLIVGADRLFE